MFFIFTLLLCLILSKTTPTLPACGIISCVFFSSPVRFALCIHQLLLILCCDGGECWVCFCVGRPFYNDKHARALFTTLLAQNAETHSANIPNIRTWMCVCVFGFVFSFFLFFSIPILTTVSPVSEVSAYSAHYQALLLSTRHHDYFPHSRGALVSRCFSYISCLLSFVYYCCYSVVQFTFIRFFVLFCNSICFFLLFMLLHTCFFFSV